MDAVKFLKEMGRMCEMHRDNPYSQRDCMSCPFEINDTSCYMEDIICKPKKAVEIVEQWSKGNSVKTYKDDFFKKFPNAHVDSSGNPRCCKNLVYGLDFCDLSDKKRCSDCWEMEMEL